MCPSTLYQVALEDVKEISFVAFSVQGVSRYISGEGKGMLFAPFPQICFAFWLTLL